MHQEFRQPTGDNTFTDSTLPLQNQVDGSRISTFCPSGIIFGHSGFFSLPFK
jgi:hypothetical protein